MFYSPKQWKGKCVILKEVLITSIIPDKSLQGLKDNSKCNFSPFLNTVELIFIAMHIFKWKRDLFKIQYFNPVWVVVKIKRTKHNLCIKITECFITLSIVCGFKVLTIKSNFILKGGKKSKFCILWWEGKKAP